MEHVSAGRFFFLDGARATGKTTHAQHVLQAAAKHGWPGLEASIRSNSSVADMWGDLSRQLRCDAARRGIALADFDSADTFCRALRREALGDQTRLIIVFDSTENMRHAPAEARDEVRASW